MKKYQEYKIIVTYMNGDKEEINYKGINTSNYKDMIKLYQDIKEEYSDKSATIDFVGVSENGELSVFWTKSNEVKEEIKNNKSITEALNDIKEYLQMFTERDAELNRAMSVLDKQQDVDLHEVEYFKGNNIEEKLKLFDSIQDTRIKRRDIKNERQILSKVNNIFKNKESIIHSIDGILELSEKLSQQDKLGYGRCRDENGKEFYIVKKVKYASEKDRIRLISQMKNKYDKVYYEGNEIICYNHAM